MDHGINLFLWQACRTPVRNEDGISLLYQYYNLLYFIDKRFFPPNKSLGIFFEWWEYWFLNLLNMSQSATWGFTSSGINGNMTAHKPCWRESVQLVLVKNWSRQFCHATLNPVLSVDFTVWETHAFPFPFGHRFKKATPFCAITRSLPIVCHFS